MKIAIGSDHAGYLYKEAIIAHLRNRGHEVKDFGTHSEEPVDYPLYVAPAAEAVARGECGRGIVLGGSGNGEAIVANKIRGIRCSVCWNADTARLAREHNDANVISIGARMIAVEVALRVVDAWLGADFQAGRHVARLEEIEELEHRVALEEKPGGYPSHEKTILIRPEYLNQRGTLFGGYMMQWADDLAYSTASLGFPKASFVTRRVDAFDFTAPVVNGDIVKIRSRVERVGSSSCMVGITCHNARTRETVFSTVAIMVHVNPEGEKAPIPA